MQRTILNILAVVTIFLAAWARPLRADDLAADFVAHHGDFFDLLFYDRSDITLHYSDQPRANGHGKNSEINDLDFDATLPVPVTVDDLLSFDFTYTRKRFAFQTELAAGAVPVASTVQSFELETDYSHFVGPDLMLSGVVSPSIRSDLETSLTRKDLELLAGGLGTYRLTHAFDLHGGCLALLRSYKSEVYPVLGFDYAPPDEPYRIDITAPFEGRAGYTVLRGVELFALATYTDEKYRSKVSAFPGQDSQIRLREIQIGGGVAVKPLAGLRLSLEGGAARGPGFDIKDGEGNTVKAHLTSTPFLAMQIGYEF